MAVRSAPSTALRPAAMSAAGGARAVRIDQTVDPTRPLECEDRVELCRSGPLLEAFSAADAVGERHEATRALLNLAVLSGAGGGRSGQIRSQTIPPPASPRSNSIGSRLSMWPIRPL